MIASKENYEANREFVKSINFVTLSSLDSVVFCLCHFDADFYTTDLFSELNILYPRALENAVVKRQAEYLAGRYAAKLALKKLGNNIYDIPIGHYRSPVWPDGVIGSITHTSDLACSAVGSTLDIDYLGVDAETWIPSVTADEIKEYVICSQEERLLRKSELGFKSAFTLAFSAKESLFKALFPHVGRYFDFNAASIEAISVNECSFDLSMKQEITRELSIGRRFKG